MTDGRTSLILDCISTDDRPTFVIEQPALKSWPTTFSSTHQSPAATPRVIFRNDAFQTFVDTLAVGASSAFQSWLPTVTALTAKPTSNAMFAGVFGSRHWTGKSLSCGWTVVYCTQKDWTTSAHRAQDNSAVQVHLEVQDDDGLTLPQRPITSFPVDWTLYPVLARDPWVTYLLDEHDWSSTEMGHPTTWTDMDLRAHVVGIMANPEPRCIFWGAEFNMIYNAACVPRLGAMHPKALGNPIADWGQGLHDHHYGQIRHTIKTGMASVMRDVPLLSNAANATTGATWTEESFHNFTFTPIPDASGHCSSFLFEYADTTAQVFSRNREKVLARITSTDVQTLDKLYTSVVDALDEDSDDVCYALLYTVTYHSAQHVFSSWPKTPPMTPEAPAYTLHSARGIESKQFAPTAPEKLQTAFRRCHEENVLLESRHDTLPGELAIETERGVVFSAYVIPVTSTLGAMLAYVVLGMNPRRPVDENRLFVTSLRDLFVRSAAMVRLPEERRKVEQANLALLDELRLTRVKAEKNHETVERLGRHAPAGMYVFDGQRRPTYANDACHKLYNTTVADFKNGMYSGFVRPDLLLSEDDRKDALALFDSLYNGTPHVDYLYQIKSALDDKTRWIEGMAFAETAANGDVVSVQGWVTDVSSRKLVESVKDQRLQEALENKRAAERFLDMISHEIRNPLSSMHLLVESILSRLPSDQPLASITLTADDLATIQDAAQTIALCIDHQKNIVTGVLELSRLDSNLVALVLQESSPIRFVEHNLMILNAEFTAAGVKSSVEVLPCYTDLKVDTVLLDFKRMGQVLINYLSNALKFTKESEHGRMVNVLVGATRQRPTAEDLGVDLVPRRVGLKVRIDPQLVNTVSDEIYIHWKIEDTGCGFTAEERKRLFERFSQANPKTHETYGGSGLGLFICREFVELHDGQVGVKSEPGVGSTFAFYVKARLTKDFVPRQDEDGGGGEVSLPSRPALQASSRARKVAKFDMHDLHILGKAGSATTSHKGSALTCSTVVEDNLVNQRVLRQQLVKAGAKTVRVANDGQEALDDLMSTVLLKGNDSNANPVSIVLSDCEVVVETQDQLLCLLMGATQMPVLDGPSFARRVRELEQAAEFVRHIPIIGITANARQQQLDHAVEAGMDCMITKPFDLAEVVARVEALVKKWQPDDLD